MASDQPGVPADRHAVHVNQLGYAPDLPKRATVATRSTAALPWRLLGPEGTVLARGATTVFGPDPASGDHAHHVDFSGYRGAGAGLRLEVAGSASHPFRIDTGLYDRLRDDALAFFYHQRSGIPIDARLVGPEYARPAGHAGVAPNRGDLDVRYRCPAGEYRRDVHGGWYDAGDHGKYVVNGGFAVWQLLNAYERARYLATPAAVGAPGMPALLDEARWEVEFLLRMQVPEGRPRAGMAFHKVHDRRWTTIPVRPDRDPEERELHPPTTAATLNLAAVAAQSARVWRRADPAFAARCRDAAVRAWRAARDEPVVYASTDSSAGGGAYADPDVTDERYWAAVELYLTTGDEEYRRHVTGSPHHPGVRVPDGYTWGETAPLGDISLAVVPSDASATSGRAAREAIVAAADAVLASIDAQAYPVPFGPDGYAWGSNGDVANLAAYAALAADFTGDARYRDGALAALDYLLGRNALGISYVTGYGTVHARNQHHRFWAHQRDPALPHPPPGTLAGGPNARLDDEISRRRLAGAPPQRCYLDDIASYATNEVAINWNSALVWLTAYAAGQTAAARDAAARDATGTRGPDAAVGAPRGGAML